MELERGKDSSERMGEFTAAPGLGQTSLCLLRGKERQESGSREAAWPWPNNFLTGYLMSGEMPLIVTALDTYKGHGADFVLGDVNRKPLTDSITEVTHRPLMMRSRGHLTGSLVDLLCAGLPGNEYHPGNLKIQSQAAFLKCGVIKHVFSFLQKLVKS